MGLDLAESMRLQAVDALANIRTRRIVVGYLPRNTATLVTNSWRSAKNQQTTRVKCGNGTTETPCEPGVISGLAGKGVVQLAGGMHNSMALLQDALDGMPSKVLPRSCRSITPPVLSLM